MLLKVVYSQKVFLSSKNVPDLYSPKEKKAKDIDLAHFLEDGATAIFFFFLKCKKSLLKFILNTINMRASAKKIFAAVFLHQRTE